MVEHRFQTPYKSMTSTSQGQKILDQDYAPNASLGGKAPTRVGRSLEPKMNKIASERVSAIRSQLSTVSIS